MPQAASPGQFTATAPSPAPFPYQSDLPLPNSNFPRSSARQHQPPAIGPREEPYPNQPTHRNGDQDSEARRSRPGRVVCVCGQRFQRRTNLEHHLMTSRRYNSPPRGPACPEPSCRHAQRFTRVDNFKSHYMRRHGKSGAEADSVIRDWRLINALAPRLG